MDGLVSFGAWLKHRRKALHLTQDALARQVGCAVVTIEKLEADARRPSTAVAERLAQVLEISPPDRGTFIKVARAELAGGSPAGLASRPTEPCPRHPAALAHPLDRPGPGRAGGVPPAAAARGAPRDADGAGRHRQDTPGAPGRRRRCATTSPTVSVFVDAGADRRCHPGGLGRRARPRRPRARAPAARREPHDLSAGQAAAAGARQLRAGARRGARSSPSCWPRRRG